MIPGDGIRGRGLYDVAMSNVVDGNEVPSADTEKLPGRLREFARAYGRMQERAAATSVGVSVAQCHVMSELSRCGPIALTELSRRLEVDKGWVSRTVDALRAEGLVGKRQHPSDARLAMVYLTRTGRSRARSLNRVLDEQAARMFDRLSPRELTVASRGLELLLAALKQEPDPGFRGDVD
jgi:DNA-binding MarR family transcriptional regulator